MEFKLPEKYKDNYMHIITAIESFLDKRGYVTVCQVANLVQSDGIFLLGHRYGWKKETLDCSDQKIILRWNHDGSQSLIFPEPEKLFIDISEEESVDMVNHPSHYQSNGGMEVINVIEAFTADLQGIEATDTGNVIKYICRWKHKNGVEDLKKARWYIDHLINKLEEESNK